MQDISNIAERYGFTLVSSEDLPEIEGVAHTLFHEKSGARLLYMQNDDPNKAFSVSFRTPAADDTGVFHILEHSVLCGSRKFPVKEPFVNLLKSSMQTFLNAMTFPDKTMYPVASTNEQDLMNLMDVYLDAVFYPAIYSKRAIFEQEGWHLEFGEDESELTYNGVVYNEMKGALSDPDTVLFDTLSAALFPDTTYRFESGGTPAGIPELSYEAFLENHRRHYRVDNSYLTLYGNLDPEPFLARIDQEYLTPLADDATAGETDEHAVPNPIEMQAPLVRTGVKQSMVTTPENACEALGFVIGAACDRERVIATDILIDAIMGSNEAPLKRAILDADIAADALAFVNDACYQPFVIVQVKGLKSGESGRLREIVEQQVNRLVAGELDHELVEAALSHAEFVMREHNFGYADGVVLSMSALTGWLYDDDLSTAYLRYEDAFAHLRKQIEEGYFEQLLREIFLENNHFAEVEVVPCEQVELSFADKRLEELANTLSSDARREIENDVAALREIQEAADTPEDLAKLPCLKVSDIGAAPDEGAFKLEDDILPCLRHHISTHGIAYAYRYFDLSCVTFDELPYVTVLSMVLGKLGTAHHSASEIDTLVQGKLGNLNFFVEVDEDISDREGYVPKFVSSTSALSKNVEFAATIPNEILLETDFSDHDKILDILLQHRLAMEQGLAVSGNTAALSRVASYYLPASVVREQLSGTDFYMFLKDLSDHFDERIESLEDTLAELSQRIFVDEGCLLSYAGCDDDLVRLAQAGIALDAGLQAAPRDLKASAIKGVPAPVDKHEAFAVPTDVTFTAMGFDIRLLDVSYALPYSGAWLVASRALSYDFLWNEVRVKGGAYGAGFSITRPGSMRFYSYRDPHIDETIDHYCASGAWLKDFEPSESEMEGYVVSTTAGLDAPLKARELLRRQDGMFFSGYTVEERNRVRDQVIASKVADVREIGGSLTQATKKHLVCTVGNPEIIDQSKEDFNVIEIGTLQLQDLFDQEIYE